VHRVVCYYEGQNWRRIVERGPWLASRAEAEEWADALRRIGYHVTLEDGGRRPADGAADEGNRNLDDRDDHDELLKALGNIA